MFTSHTKRAVTAKKYTNVQKSVMHVQSCCFVSLNLSLLIGRFRWRRRRRCLRSLFIPIQVFIWDKSNSFQQQLVMADRVLRPVVPLLFGKVSGWWDRSKLNLCPASVHKADKKNLLVALFRIVPTPQHTSEPTIVSATPRNTEMICLQKCRKDVLKYKPPKNFYYFLINLKILDIAFIDIHIFVKENNVT